jgi:hypothetical protein
LAKEKKSEIYLPYSRDKKNTFHRLQSYLWEQAMICPIL